MPAVRRTTPAEPLLGPRDYADAFEVVVDGPTGGTAVEWLRVGLEGAPPALRALVLAAHRHVLRFDLGPLTGPGHVLGWRVVVDEPDVAQLAAASPLLDAVIVGRRAGPDRAVLTTGLRWRRRVLAPVVWVAVGPVHRRVAPYLLRQAASRSAAGSRTG